MRSGWVPRVIPNNHWGTDAQDHAARLLKWVVWQAFSCRIGQHKRDLAIMPIKPVKQTPPD